MTNPVFTSNKVFTQRTPAGYPTMPGYEVGGSAPQATPADQAFNSPYGQGLPSNTPMPESYSTNVPASRPMTLDDVLIKSLISFGVLLLGGAVSWMLVEANPTAGYGLMVGGTIVAFVLALINSFKRRVSPVLVLAYALSEGLALGAISRLFSYVADGAVPKAIAATVVTLLVMLVAFKTRVVRNSPTLMRVVLIGMTSILVFYLLNFVVSLFFPAANFYSVTLFGFPLWVVVSLAAIVLAALSLVTDFDFIVQAVENRAPVETSWTAAFGLMVTLVWLYLEFLRLFALLSSND